MDRENDISERQAYRRAKIIGDKVNLSGKNVKEKCLKNIIKSNKEILDEILSINKSKLIDEEIIAIIVIL